LELTAILYSLLILGLITVYYDCKIDVITLYNLHQKVISISAKFFSLLQTFIVYLTFVYSKKVDLTLTKLYKMKKRFVPTYIL